MIKMRRVLYVIGLCINDSNMKFWCPLNIKLQYNARVRPKKFSNFAKIYLYVLIYTRARVFYAYNLNFSDYFQLFYQWGQSILIFLQLSITYQTRKFGGNLLKTLSLLSSFQKWNTIHNMSVVSCHFKILNTYKHGLWIYDAVVLKRRGYQPFWNVSSYHVLDCQKIYPK